MLALVNILGRGEEDEAVKIVIFVIAGIIWVVSAIISAAKKQKKKQQEEAWRRKIEEMNQQPPGEGAHPPQPPPHPPTPPPAVRRSLPPKPVRMQKVQRRFAPKPAMGAKPRPVVRAVPGPPSEPEEAVHSHVAGDAAFDFKSSQSVAARTEIGSRPPAPPKPAIATAPSVAAWLQPATLRKQYILTEILQPPMALRENRSH